MTLGDHKKECEKLIQLYKAYLLSRGIDAKHRHIAWSIVERDALDEDNLIEEIARLSEVVKRLSIISFQDKAFLDEPHNYYTETIENNFKESQLTTTL